MRIESTASWVLFIGCIGAIFGVAAASWLMGEVLVFAVLAASIVFGFLLRTLPVHDRVKMVAVFILGVALGVGRYSVAGPGAESIAHDVGRAVIVEGRVVGAETRDYGVAYILDNLSLSHPERSEGSPGSRTDRIRVEAPISSSASLGSYLRISCVLDQPEAFDGFAYDRFLAAKSMYAICRTSTAPFEISPPAKALDELGGRGEWSEGVGDLFWRTIGALHDGISNRARAILPEPQATLLLGLLIGENGFSDAWSEKFRTTGTSHIVAASGYNVAIVAQFALLFLVSIGLYRRQAYPIVIAAIGIFVVVAGAGGAAVRAGIMGVLALTARHMGRHASVRNILALTVVVMLLVEPRLLRDDVGFQLSVTATMGLIFFTDRIATLLKHVPTTFGVRESLASTLAATIATLPVTMVSFGTVSIIAPIVNMLVLPFIPYAMAFGAFAIAASEFFSSAISVFLALPAWTMLATMTSLIHEAAKMPFALIEVPSGIVIVIGASLLAAIGALIRKLPRAFARDLDVLTTRKIVTVAGILILLFAVQISTIAYRSGRFNDAEAHVFVFDVGQGDAIFIDGAERDVIIDGGPTRRGLLEALALVRFPWERSIDVAIASHPHADHILGLIALIDAYEVDEVIKNGIVYTSPAVEALENPPPAKALDELSGRGERSEGVATANMRWQLGPESTLEILWPLDDVTGLLASNVHERNIVAKLTVGEKTMVFMGDAEGDIEEALGEIGAIDVLKVGHHGSDTSSSDAFLQSITPSIAVISVGEGNSYGHPSPFVLGRLSAVGSRVLRTDDEGTLRLDFWRDAIETSAD